MIKHSEAEAATAQSDQVVAILGEIAERSRKLVEDFVARQSDLRRRRRCGSTATRRWAARSSRCSRRVMSQPQELMQAQFGLWQDYVRLWQSHDPAHARASRSSR